MNALPGNALERFADVIRLITSSNGAQFIDRANNHEFREVADTLGELVRELPSLLALAEYGADMMAVCERNFSARETRAKIATITALLEKLEKR